jgi:hypothetical protein
VVVRDYNFVRDFHLKNSRRVVWQENIQNAHQKKVLEIKRMETQVSLPRAMTKLESTFVSPTTIPQILSTK